MFKRILPHILIILLFFVLTVFFTYPLFTGKTVGTTDSLYHLWLISQNNHQFFSDPLDLFHSNIFAPHKYTLAFTENEIALSLIATPILEFSADPILAYNFLIIFGFVVSGYGMYLLVHYLVKDKLIAVLAGIIYAFAPYKITHGFDHLNLTGLWLPFVFLFCHNFFKTKSWRDLLWLSFFTILTAWSSLQCFIFLPFVFLIFIFVNYKMSNWDKKMVGKLLIFILLISICVLPVFYPYLKTKQLYNFSRPESEIRFYSPVFLDYFLPGFGVKYYNQPGLFPFMTEEYVITPGIIVWLLFISGLLILFRNRNKFLLPDRKNLFIYASIGLIGFLLSLGLFLNFSHYSNANIVGPFYVLHYLMPGFNGIRAPGRFSLFFLIFLIVIISFGLSKFFARQKKWLKRIMLIAITFLLLTEFSFAQQPREKFADTFQMRRVPLVYDWLKNQPGDFIIMELPLGWNKNSGSFDPLYVYYSIHHFKKIVNGYSGYAPPDYYQLNSNFEEFELSKVEWWLKKYQVKYLIFHRDKYEELRGKKEAECVFQIITANPKTFLLVYQSGEDYVYTLINTDR